MARLTITVTMAETATPSMDGQRPPGNVLKDWNRAQLSPYQKRQLAAPDTMPATAPAPVALGHQQVKMIGKVKADAPTEKENATIHCTAAIGLTAKAKPKTPRITVTQRAIFISCSGVMFGFTKR